MKTPSLCSHPIPSPSFLALPTPPNPMPLVLHPQNVIQITVRTTHLRSGYMEREKLHQQEYLVPNHIYIWKIKAIILRPSNLLAVAERGERDRRCGNGTKAFFRLLSFKPKQLVLCLCLCLKLK